VLAHLSGMRIVEMVHEDLRLSKVLTKQAFENAIRVNAAIGGSTNAVIHLKAIAGRIGVELDLDDWTRIGRGMPTIVDLQPSGRFLMEEFYYAGGLPAVIRRLGEHQLLPNPDALTTANRSGTTALRPRSMARTKSSARWTIRYVRTAVSAYCAAISRPAVRC